MTPEAGRSTTSAGTTQTGAVAGRMVRALLLVVLVVFVFEFLIMQWIEVSADLHVIGRSLVDAGLLAALLLPILLFLFVRPVVRAARGWASAEQALRGARENLERQVEDRTAALLNEVEEKEEANRKIQAQAVLLDAVQQAVLATDTEGRLTYANRFAAEMFGWAQGSAIGEPFRNLCSFAVELAEGVCGQQAGESAEVEIRRSDGTVFPALVTSSEILGADGEFAGCVYVATEITALKRIQEELRYSEAKYSALVQQSPTGIFLARAGKIIFANPTFLEIAGRSAEDIGSLWVPEIIHPEDRHLVAAMGGEGPPATVECRIVRPATGDVRWVSGLGVALPYQGGDTFLGNIQDITYRKATEKRLEESREALRRLSGALLTAQEDERKRVSRELHDSIGQQLSFIYLKIDDIVGLPRADERRTQLLALRELLPKIQESIDEVRRIFMALRPPMLDDLGLLPTVAWFLRAFQTARPGVQVATALDVPESAIPDRLKIVIFRILQEAVNNVAKHSHAKRLEVELTIEDGALRLLVMDDGVGLDPAGTAAGVGREGLGLGSMAERAQLSGGACRVRAAPGGGTTVEAAWPLQPGVVSER